MYTLGYDFKPWRAAEAIADGPSIRATSPRRRPSTASRRMRFGHRVLAADWSAADACWTVTVQRDDRAEPSTLRARFLHLCSGYYRYDRGHRPHWPGEARLPRPVVHPQFWPAGLDTRRPARGGDRQRRHRRDAGARAGPTAPT
jgi:monooxygenase